MKWRKNRQLAKAYRKASAEMEAYAEADMAVGFETLPPEEPYAPPKIGPPDVELLSELDKIKLKLADLGVPLGPRRRIKRIKPPYYGQRLATLRKLNFDNVSERTFSRHRIPSGSSPTRFELEIDCHLPIWRQLGVYRYTWAKQVDARGLGELIDYAALGFYEQVKTICDRMDFDVDVRYSTRLTTPMWNQILDPSGYRTLARFAITATCHARRWERDEEDPKRGSEVRPGLISDRLDEFVDELDLKLNLIQEISRQPLVKDDLFVDYSMLELVQLAEEVLNDDPDDTIDQLRARMEERTKQVYTDAEAKADRLIAGKERVDS